MYKYKLIIPILFLPFFMLAQNSWELKKNANAIKIYTRTTSSSDIKEFKATTEIDAPLDTILNKLIIGPKYTKNCLPDINYFVEKINKNQSIYYSYKDLPWPAKDRDVVTLLTINRIDNKTVTLTLNGSPYHLPEKDKTIRVKNFTGHWILKEDENRKTSVTHELFLDPEGQIPSFIINTLLVNAPYKLFRDLHKTSQKQS